MAACPDSALDTVEADTRAISATSSSVAALTAETMRGARAPVNARPEGYLPLFASTLHDMLCKLYSDMPYFREDFVDTTNVAGMSSSSSNASTRSG